MLLLWQAVTSDYSKPLAIKQRHVLVSSICTALPRKPRKQPVVDKSKLCSRCHDDCFNDSSAGLSSVKHFSPFKFPPAHGFTWNTVGLESMVTSSADEQYISVKFVIQWCLMLASRYVSVTCAITVSGFKHVGQINFPAVKISSFATSAFISLADAIFLA